MTFLVKVRRGRPPVAAQEVAVRWREKRRPVRTIKIGGQTLGQVVENDGWDRKLATVRPTGDPRAVDARGHQASHHIAGPVPWTAAGIKTVLRRMRPEEEATIAGIDAEIAVLEGQIWQARNRREQAVQQAWDKAHVVRLNELDPKEGY